MAEKALKRHYGAFSRPAIGGKSPHPGRELPSIDRNVLLLGTVGRTIPNLQTLNTHAEVDALADDLGYEKPSGWRDLAVTTKLDVLGTHLIENSRTMARQSEFVLSPYQWYARTRREIPMTHEQLQAVVTHVRWARTCRGPLTDTDPTKMVTLMRLRDHSDQKAREVRRG